MRWTTYKPVFNLDIYDKVIYSQSAWIGHMNFAYDLVRFVKPNKIVELGTHYGASFFSFCQGAKDHGLSTKCFAIDTWAGDPHTGAYGEGIYLIVKKVSENCFSDVATMLRSTFDEAVNTFEDESINILHIDGYHTYEAVSHDYHTWLPKVSQNGIVLFHDIAVRSGDFGVYKLWDELKAQYPHLEFKHSYGLGVLFPKGHSDEFHAVLQQKENLQKMYEEQG
ncbi:class I SAM-dependent methyltransferase [Bacillus sp. C1]